MKTTLKDLIGKTIKNIHINTKFIKFTTEKGEYIYEVTGECCSTSFFYDFYGVKSLLGKVVSDVKKVKLISGDVLSTNTSFDLTQIYGYQIFNSEDEWDQPTNGVFSFRNESNGYYGGEIVLVSALGQQLENEWETTYKHNNTGEMIELTEDLHFLDND